MVSKWKDRIPSILISAALSAGLALAGRAMVDHTDIQTMQVEVQDLRKGLTTEQTNLQRHLTQDSVKLEQFNRLEEKVDRLSERQVTQEQFSVFERSVYAALKR